MADETQTSSSTVAGVGSTMEVKIKPYDEVINFGIWQRRMRGVLVQSNLHVALLGLEKKPNEMTEDQWNDIDSKAMSAIEMHVTDEVLRNLMSEKNAKDMWTRLEEMYIGKSMSNKLNLKKQLFKLEMKEGEDLNKHINVFKAIVHDLERIDIVFKEKDCALLLFASFPDSYDHFVTTLIFGKTTLKFNEVVKDLQSHVAMKKGGNGSSSSSSEGLVAKSGGGKRSGRLRSWGAKNRGTGRTQS